MGERLRNWWKRFTKRSPICDGCLRYVDAVVRENVVLYTPNSYRGEWIRTETFANYCETCSTPQHTPRPDDA